jgi:nanoRNase/pAp phosphatase (c-di-AMP/oligoRNAs hydrolase)
LLKDKGWGGGHDNMAGGFIPIGRKKDYLILLDVLKKLIY